MTPEARSYQLPAHDNEYHTLIITVSELVEHRFASDEALDRGYL